MNRIMLSKILAVAIILLFLGLAIQPSIASKQIEIDIEPKDYLFQTIIDIANNPEVKNLLEQYKYDLLEFDIDKSNYRKLLIRNPRLMFNTLFTKPYMSVDYLNNCYNSGIAITNILGEDEVLEIIEKVEITDTKLLDELNTIIMNAGEFPGIFDKIKDILSDIFHILGYYILVITGVILISIISIWGFCYYNGLFPILCNLLAPFADICGGLFLIILFLLNFWEL